MKKFFTGAACLLLSGSVVAAHHEEAMPQVAEIYDCNLNEGVTADQLAALGAGDFAALVEKHDLNMTSFLWEAVSVNQPYDQVDVRWVNYFPSWVDYGDADVAWRAHGGKVAAKINKLATCAKPTTWSVQQAGEEAPSAPVKPLYIRVCNLKEGNTMKNAMAYRKAVNAAQNAEIEGAVGSYVFMPGFGFSGFDYAAMVTGTPDDMMQVLDNNRTGSTVSALQDAGLSEPATCVVDLHRSIMMVN